MLIITLLHYISQFNTFRNAMETFQSLCRDSLLRSLFAQNVMKPNSRTRWLNITSDASLFAQFGKVIEMQRRAFFRVDLTGIIGTQILMLRVQFLLDILVKSCSCLF